MIFVEAVRAGWRVYSPGHGDGQVFESGWKAEMAARELGRSLADAGDRSTIRIFLRGGELAGDILCGPDEPPSH